MNFNFNNPYMTNEYDFDGRSIRRTATLGQQAWHVLESMFTAGDDVIKSFFKAIAALMLNFTNALLTLRALIEAIALTITYIFPLTVMAAVAAVLAAVTKSAAIERFVLNCKTKIQSIVKNSIKITTLASLVLGVSLGVITALEVFSLDSALSYANVLFPPRLIVAVAAVGAIWKDKVNAFIQNLLYTVGLAREPAKKPRAESELAAHDRYAEAAGAVTAAGVTSYFAPSLMVGLVGPAVVVGSGMTAAKALLGEYRRFVAEEGAARASASVSSTSQSTATVVSPPPVATATNAPVLGV